MVATARVTQWQIAISVLDADQNVLSGPHTIDPALFLIQIDFPGLNTEGPNGWLPWTGSLTLLDVDALTLSIDSRDTAATPTGAALLAQGNAVDLRQFVGGSYQRGWPTLYIISEPNPLDQPLEATVRVELGDITRLDDDDQDSVDERGKKIKRRGITPEGNLSGMTLGTLTNRSAIANNILSARGLPTSTDTITQYPLSVPAQKFGTNAWGNEIGKLVGTAGHFFWIDKDDNARFTPIDLDKSAPDFSLTIGIDEVDHDSWKRVNLSKRPPAKLTVTGTGGRAIARDNPEVITDIRPEKETTYTRTISVLTNRVTEVTEERLSERLILPRIPTQGSSGGESVITGYTENTSTSLRLARRETIISDYSAFTKELKTRQIVVEAARAIAGGDAFRDTDALSDGYDLLSLEQTTINYSYQDGRLSDRETRTQRSWAIIPWANVRPNNYAANRFLVQTNLTKEESWRKRLLVGQDWKYEFETQVPQGELKSYVGPDINASVLRADPDRSGTIESSENGAARPPATEYMPLLYEQDNQQYEGCIEITPLAGQAYKNRERTVAIQGPYVVSDAQCEFLAEIIGRLEHGLSLGQQFVGAIPSWLISSFTPGARVDVTDNGLVKSYFLNGFTITADAESTLWGCSLAELGTIGAAPGDVTPPVSVVYPISVATQVPTPGVAGSIARAESAAVATQVPVPGSSLQISSPIGISASTQILSPGVSIIAAETGVIAAATPLSSPGVSLFVQAPDPDAEAYISRQTGTYSQAELDAIRAFFAQIKADGIYSFGDACYLFGAADTANDAGLNIFGASYTANSVNMTFTVRQGFTGNGSTSYIGTGFTPSTAGGNYGLNGASVGAYLRLNIAEESLAYGARSTSGGDTRVFLYPRRSSGDESLSMLNARTSSITATVTDSRRLFLTSRTASNLTTSYRDGASIGSTSVSPVAVVASEIYLGGYNNVGVLNLSSSNQIGFGWVGGALDATQAANLATAVNTLLTAFGSNV